MFAGELQPEPGLQVRLPLPALRKEQDDKEQQDDDDQRTGNDHVVLHEVCDERGDGMHDGTDPA